MSQLKLTNIWKIFFEKEVKTSVLKGISIEITAGETIAVTGASGAGKTTLLNIMGTLDVATEGEVTFEGAGLSSLNEARLCEFRNRALGFVFQFHHLLPDFSACENVMMPLLIRGTPSRVARGEAQIILEKVGLKMRMKHRPRELSGGEQQRVAIARALVGKPRLVLADEPTGNLDAEAGRQIFDLLLALNREYHSTLVVASHNEKLTSKLDRTLRIVDGKI